MTTTHVSRTADYCLDQFVAINLLTGSIFLVQEREVMIDMNEFLYVLMSEDESGRTPIGIIADREGPSSGWAIA